MADMQTIRLTEKEYQAMQVFLLAADDFDCCAPEWMLLKGKILPKFGVLVYAASHGGLKQAGGGA